MKLVGGHSSTGAQTYQTNCFPMDGNIQQSAISNQQSAISRQPLIPKTKRLAMKTSAIGGSSEFHHQIVIAKLKNRDEVEKVSGSNST